MLTSLSALKNEDCFKSITIRHEPHSVGDAITRQVAHYSSQVGQVILLAKCTKADKWQTLSIEKHGSNAFNEKTMGTKH